jgi:hypothetical protein
MGWWVPWRFLALAFIVAAAVVVVVSPLMVIVMSRTVLML